MVEDTKSLAEANKQETKDSIQSSDAGKAVEEKKQEQKPAEQAPVQAERKQSQPQPAETRQLPPPFQRKQRKLRLYKVKNLFKKLHPVTVKSKLHYYWFEYSRVLHLARKPTRSEYKELAIMVTLGTIIIGAIGFVVQLIIQYI